MKRNDDFLEEFYDRIQNREILFRKDVCSMLGWSDASFYRIRGSKGISSLSIPEALVLSRLRKKHIQAVVKLIVTSRAFQLLYNTKKDVDMEILEKLIQMTPKQRDTFLNSKTPLSIKNGAVTVRKSLPHARLERKTKKTDR